MLVFAMPENGLLSENDMARAAVAWLQQRVPSSWQIGPTGRAEIQAKGAELDAAIDLQGPNGVFTTMVVEVKRDFGPRDVDKLLMGVGRTLRLLSPNIPILLVVGPKSGWPPRGSTTSISRATPSSDWTTRRSTSRPRARQKTPLRPQRTGLVSRDPRRDD